MTVKRWDWFPVTLLQPGTLVPVSVAFEASYDSEADDGWGAGPGQVTVGWDPEARVYNVTQILVDNEEEFTWLAGTQQMTVRPSVPDDATSGQFGTIIPWPTEIMGAFMNGQTTSQPALAAAIDEQGDVHTMVLETDFGLYVRYSRNWIRLTDIAPIETLNIVNVAEVDLETYDEADTSGQQLNIDQLHPVEGTALEVVPAPPGPEEGAPPAPVTAGASPVRSLLVASADDLPEAIAFAATDEGQGSRWYIAKRARALGWSEPFPWEES